MKSKIYIFFFFVMLTSGLLKAQTNTILYNGFNNYNGLAATIEPGWFYSYNDTVLNSFYNSVGFFGIDSPSYKFGVDMATIISPAFSNADSLRFWMKGNGTPKDSNTFEIYTSVDSLSWTLISSMDSISSAIKIIQLPVSNADKYVKFYYKKLVSGYNVGLDDIAVLKNSGVGITESAAELNQVNVFPSPTKGQIHIVSPSNNLLEVVIYDLIGNKLKNIPYEISGENKITMTISGHKPGFYFVRIKTDKGLITKRITLE